MPVGIKAKILYWLQLRFLLLYVLIRFFPRDKNLWVFGSSFGKRFADNPRYLYLYLSDKKDLPVRPVWISADKTIVEFLNSKGLEAYHQRSLKGRFYALRAKVYIYDNYSKDINFALSAGAVKVNLWHGVGNKRINHDNIHDRVRHPKNLRERIATFPRRISDEKPTDYILCTSEEMGAYFEKAFRVLPGHVLCEGYPRCDALFEDDLLQVLTGEEEELLREMDDRKPERVIVYLPTFRESENKFFDIMDMERFDAFLGERGYLFVIKPHPKSAVKSGLADLHSDNILVVPSGVDVYTFLGRADMLVTDYSSVYTDYMLLERPVIAFIYDEEEYLTDSRDYFIDREQYMPERCAKDMDALMLQIEEAFENDECLPARRKARERMFDIPGPGACERVYKRIAGLI